MRIKMFKKAGIALVLALSFICTAGCQGDSNVVEQTGGKQEQTAGAVTESSVSAGTVAADGAEDVVYEAQEGAYILRVKRTGSKKIQDELSPYNNLYEGTYIIETVEDDTVKDAYTVAFDSDPTLYFPQSFDLPVFDLDEDGQLEFSLGQKDGSSAMEYHFYTLTSQGKIKEYKKKDNTSLVIVTDGREGYFPEFQVENGEITYFAYDQETAKTVKKVKKVV